MDTEEITHGPGPRHPSARGGLIAYAGLMLDLSALLGRKVDLVEKAGLKPLIRPQILSEARVVYAMHLAPQRIVAH